MRIRPQTGHESAAFFENFFDREYFPKERGTLKGRTGVCKDEKMEAMGNFIGGWYDAGDSVDPVFAF